MRSGPCATCGVDRSTISAAEAISSLRSLSDRYRQAITPLLDAATYAVHEGVHHLGDIERQREPEAP